MPKLPEATDYGARPSLRSNRLDMPGNTTATGDALTRAADTFANVLVDRKTKQDRLNYALAKAKILQADIDERQKLAEDEDWETHDKRYRTGIGTRRDEIYSKYKLTPHDAAILGAESDLIIERGAVQVGERARKVKIDQHVAELNDDLLVAAENVKLADPATANDMMLTQLDSINAAEEKGYITDRQAQDVRMRFVESVAVDRLITMDPKDRERELERSLTKRKTTGRISQEDIAAGKGTGSIADFLPAEIVAKMLRETKAENEIDDTNNIAYAVADEAWELYPDVDQGKERQAHIRNKLKGNPDARSVADRVLSSRTNAEQAADNAAVREDIKRESHLMEELAQAWQDAETAEEKASIQRYTYDDIPASVKRNWSATQRAQMLEYSNRVNQGKFFADTTNNYEHEYDENGNLVRPSWAAWSEMSNAEKARQDLTEPMWKLNFDEEDWRRALRYQETIRSGAQVKIPGGLTNSQLVSAVLRSMGEISSAGGKMGDEAKKHGRTLNALDHRIQIRQEQEGRELTNDERREELTEILKETAYTDRDEFLGWIGLDSHYDEHERKSLAEMSQDEVEMAFLKYEDAQKELVPYGGQVVTLVDYFEAQAKLKGWPKPSKRQIERAYFAFKLKIGATPEATELEVLRRLEP